MLLDELLRCWIEYNKITIFQGNHRRPVEQFVKYSHIYFLAEVVWPWR